MDAATITATLDAAIDQHGFSGVVSIRHRDAVLYERAAGYADRSNKIPNTLDTRFGIASGTKFLTALAIGKLIAAKQLAFSTKLTDCVGLSFPHYSPEITIRHLLTHTSGIPDYYDEEKITDFDAFALSVPSYALHSPRDYLVMFPDEPMRFAPGDRFSYSNGGFILLGLVIEALTGLSYQKFVEQEIFKPSGMNRSGFFALNKLPEQTAFGYIEEADGWRTNIYNLPIVGASDGGAFTTLHDIVALWKAFWKGEILPQALVEAFTQPYVRAESEGEHTYYGHGLWLIAAENQIPTVYLVGGDAGVSFKSSVDRNNALQVTVISNTTGGAWLLVREIEQVLLSAMQQRRP